MKIKKGQWFSISFDCMLEKDTKVNWDTFCDLGKSIAVVLDTNVVIAVPKVVIKDEGKRIKAQMG